MAGRSQASLKSTTKSRETTPMGRARQVEVRIVKHGAKSELELRNRLRMPRRDFSRLVNVSERAIADVESGKKSVAKLKRPYNEVNRVFTALCEVVQPDALGDWFVTPNDAFDGFKPLEVIERGEIDRLWDVVYRLRTGVPG